MYLTCARRKGPQGKTYETWLLRRSYREDGKVKNETIANLKDCSKEEIRAIDMALKNKSKSSTEILQQPFEITQGRSVGSVFILHQIAKRLGIIKALGNDFHGKLALWLIFARILEQGSRLSATRLDSAYDMASVIGFERGFDENNCYDCLHWLSENQVRIENSLFRRKQQSSQFYFYDVTSTYLEGQHNELAAYGYNRDKKMRKKIIVVGLLCQNEGDPVAVEAFRGNTQDTQTLESQLIKLRERFECQSLVIVGDRGMIRKKQKKLTEEHGFYYITALTMPEINSFLDAGILKLDDFSNELKSVLHQGIRYIYRCNPARARETQNQRKERLNTAQKRVNQENLRLASKPKSSSHPAKKRTQKYLERLCIDAWVKVKVSDKKLYLVIDEETLKVRSRFDGCYVWTTDVPEKDASDRTIYERYKDLKYVEEDFRSLKTCFLNIRPVFVRSEASTRGHILTLMLAHMIVKELRTAWSKMNVTTEEGLAKLSLLCQNRMQFQDRQSINFIPAPNDEMTRLLEALNIKMPKSLNEVHVSVVTRRKLTRKS